MTSEPIDTNVEEVEEKISVSAEEPTAMPGLTATMEIAGVESIAGAQPDKIILGFSRES